MRRALVRSYLYAAMNSFSLAARLLNMKVTIRERSLVAWVASQVLAEKQVAIVTGSTIHLWNTSRAAFLENRSWVLHELTHVHQFRKYGWLKFVFLYLAESVKKGYFNNRFEVEARLSENREAHVYDVEFV
mgnify:FL=1